MKAKLFSLLLLPSLSWAVPNISDGKLLYDESCAKCHHTPYQSLGWNEMTNRTELRYMIEACSDHFQLEWNAKDVEDTEEFLNTEFFLFD
ncbi:hypothetical protein [uncultured Gammaproteobacteria bacterium]|nr:hypothetical protein [uncultured Gammaproteobacteria bacterium]